MAGERKSPKKPSPKSAPLAVPFLKDGEPTAELMEALMSEAAQAIVAAKLFRVVLHASVVEAETAGLETTGVNTLQLEEPEVEHDHSREQSALRVLCTFVLRAVEGSGSTRASGRGGGKKERQTLLMIEATFLLDYMLDPSVPMSDSQIHAFSESAGVSHAWPYWREYVRDASTRAGFPVINVPYDVVF